MDQTFAWTDQYHFKEDKLDYRIILNDLTIREMICILMKWVGIIPEFVQNYFNLSRSTCVPVPEGVCV